MNMLKKIAKENARIYTSGFYINNNDEVIDISKEVKKSVNESIYLKDVPIKKDYLKNQEYYKVENHTEHVGTIDCIINLRDDGEKGNIVALNFASATNPGGGYLNGCTAQEESLCRASMLYPCLVANKQMYKDNKSKYTPLYSDRMIYSPDVVVFRNDKGEVLDKFVQASFITSPAVNRKIAKALFISDFAIEKVMDIRIRKIISLALEQSPSVIILGAFGCGVFGNDRKLIYELFENVINDLVPLDKVKVVFAVRDNVPKNI